MTREKYESLPLATLKELAKARKMRGVSTLKKSELIDAMLALDEKEAQEEAATEAREEVREEMKEKKAETAQESDQELLMKLLAKPEMAALLKTLAKGL